MSETIIDSAVRLPAEDGRLQVARWFEMAERWGISHSVVAPPDEFVAVYNDDGNDQLAALVRKFPRKLSGLAVANPWYGRRAVNALERAFEDGLCGLYLHPGRQGFHLSDSILDPLMNVCRKYGKPVYSYTGTPVCAMPFQLAELARRFADLTFVMGHLAWSDFSGYDAIPAALQAPNIVLESSCGVVGTLQAAIEQLGIERVVFGTGYPRSLPEPEFDKFRKLDLSDEARGQLVHGNAARVWGIPV